MSRSVSDEHLRLAADICRQLGEKVDDQDMQIVLTLTLLYHCATMDVAPDRQLEMMKRNMLLLRKKGLVRFVVDNIHRYVSSNRVFMPSTRVQ